VKFHTGTSEVLATTYLLRDGNLTTGAEDIVQVRFNRPVVVGPGDRFIIRSLTPVQTIGGGLILEPVSRRLKRNRPGLLDSLAEQAAAVGNLTAFVEHCIRTAERLAVGRDEICRRAKVQPERLQPILDDLRQRKLIVDLEGGEAVHKATAEQAVLRMMEAIAEYHRRSPQSPGMSWDQLSEACGWDKPLLDTLLLIARQTGRVVERAQRYALAGHREAFSDQESRLLEKVESLFTERLFQPPGLDEVRAKVGLAPKELTRVIRLLVEHDRLVRLADDLVFHKAAVERAREIVLEYFRKETRLESVKFKYLVDTTRKYAIPLLDYLDRIGVTSRVGNTRFLKGSRNAGPAT
jgi:selenocysteine-specific elongation factor